MIVVMTLTFATLMTGVHVVRPGEIGFVYRGRKFLGHTGPAFVLATPIIGRVYRMKAESLHVLVESSVPETEILLEIADHSRFPIAEKDVDSEIRSRTSESVLEALSRQDTDGGFWDARTSAEDIRNRLNTSFKEMGLVVKYVRLGDHTLEVLDSSLARARILDFEDAVRRLES